VSSEVDIDLFKYGQLVAQVDAMERKIDKLEKGMEELLELANKSKGSLWAIMSLTAGVSTFVGFLSHYFTAK
jgi:hypothetical protein